ncbi:MAG: alpha/beta hydrolase [Ignavibacteria bacterium]|nr:alpha/beta hydrolase [Ignavibacteria bacterium]
MKEKIIDGITIFDYEGSGEILLFIHAFPLTSKMWDKQVNYFKENFRVITYDVRGLGKSQQKNNQFTLEEYANDLIEICNKMQITKINACGLSMGGYIILRALEKKSELFSRVILADTRAERDTDEGLIMRSNAIIDIKNGKIENVLNDYLKKLLSEKNYNNSEIRNYIFNMMKSNSAEGIIGAILAIATRTSTLKFLTNIDIPALILVGEYDSLTPLNYAQDMKNALRDSTLAIIPNSGHLSNIENPDYFNDIVNDFLTKKN